MPRKRPYASIVVFAASVAVFACEWDRDTLLHEAFAMPDVIQVAVGRFERNPPLYYQMRIDREAPQVKKNPKQLDLYDDLAVASDRLGDDDLAIRWMERKHAEMGDISKARTVDGKRDAFSEAAYRYYANVGTFWIHRWARHGAKKEAIDQAKHARDLIAKAIEINPDAHFGRETIQLRVMEWLIVSRGNKDAGTLGAYLDEGMETRGVVSEQQRKKSVRGLIGLIVLGAGWESPDMYEALASEMDGEYRSISKLGFFVRMREKELLDSGKKPFVEDEFLQMVTHTTFQEEETIRSEYKRLREEAEQWSAARTGFMVARLRAGRHPDTDPHFWDGYVSKPAPHIEYTLWDRVTSEQRLFLALGSCCSIPIILGFAVWKRVRFIRRKRNIG
jgi:hypothetical protein